MSRVSPLLTMYNVSIPQAVGTIAILISIMILERLQQRFNTASGRYYCNYRVVHNGENLLVCFNTASGRYYCNNVKANETVVVVAGSFNTASGRYYCNLIPYKASIHGA